MVYLAWHCIKGFEADTDGFVPINNGGKDRRPPHSIALAVASDIRQEDDFQQLQDVN
jgi:hypothetical protein